MNHLTRFLTLLLITAILFGYGTLSGCSSPSNNSKVEAEKGHEGESSNELKEAEEKSDLDQTAEELFAATCEHKIKTFECDECRYETGVVKVPADLVKGGLLKLTKVENRTAATPLVITGEVGFDEELVSHVNLQSEVIVRKVITHPGKQVAKGALLIEVESAEIGSLQGDYLEAKSLLKLAQKSSERSQSLFKDQIISEREYLQSKHDLDAAQIKCDALLNKLHRQGMDSIDLAQLSMASGRFMIRAPIAGKVLAINALAGETSKTDQPLVTIGESSRMWIWADVYERDLPALAKVSSTENITASVKVKELPDESFTGVVQVVNPTVDHTTRTIKIRIAIANPKSILMAGMFTEVTIFLPGNEQALSLDKAAIMDDEGRTFVFIHHHDDYYLRRPVTVGRSWSVWSEVTSGLTGAESVVADGAFLLKSDVLRSKMGAGCAD